MATRQNCHIGPLRAGALTQRCVSDCVPKPYTWTIISGNYAIKVRVASDNGAWLAETVYRFSRDDFRTNDFLWSTIHASIPSHRLT